ncbi:metal ABC transporter ATP-binding protein [Actinospica sp.]|jgi:zinc/manganese transport system ATP-binding protein|uniref:metal ABC transporter ATP-binding protein n=1 Tax=Actinospica sp. TaxID=1872142 RepID=UPI002BA1BD41|nr:ATP-binding cassette domain-containing protein [Actinospica sp.]HWG28636.1 ATP-binding cassette domain-containing protein [Actinospica sp.]
MTGTSNEIAPRGPENVLALDEVSIRLGGRQVLDQVSFALAAGEFTGLIGSNGAGKTTLLRIVMGLRAADAGTVRVGGKPLTRRARGVGYVPQKIQIEPDAPLRARDLIALGLDGEKLGPRLPSRQRRATVEQMLDAVDATRFADERVGTLSGGEQQRILIAHALIGRPRLLLMDEPLANLDLRSGQEIVELTSRVARDQSVAVLLSAHDINPLLPVMDKVVYLAEGRAACGTTDQVVRSEVLSGLYRHPVSVLRVDGRILVVAGSTVTADTLPADTSPANGERANGEPLAVQA